MATRFRLRSRFLGRIGNILARLLIRSMKRQGL